MMEFVDRFKFLLFAIILLITSTLGFVYFRFHNSKKTPERELSAQERIFENKLLVSLYEEKLVDYNKVMEEAAIAYNQKAAEVLGESAEATPIPLYPEEIEGAYKIAIVGDSMVETMGDSLEYLQEPLKEKYPNAKFVFYNYGHGSENVESAVNRLDAPFSRLNRNYPALSDLKPDVLVVASYAYNPLVPYSKDNHWAGLVELVTKANQITDNLYILVEIAPLEKGFGEGVGGVNWPVDVANEHAGHIVELLQNGLGVAETMKVPLINVYSHSKLKDSSFGDPKYVDAHDGIHPSVEGQKLTARAIAEVVKLK